MSVLPGSNPGPGGQQRWENPQLSCAGTFVQQLGVFDRRLPASAVIGDVLVRFCDPVFVNELINCNNVMELKLIKLYCNVM